MAEKKLSLPKLVIFDMDGLLFDTETLFKREKGIVMKKYGLTLTDEDYEKTLGVCGAKLAEVLLEIYGPDYPAQTISKETRARVTAEILKNGPPVKEGIPELLEWLYERRIPCCVASSTQTETVKAYIARGGFDRYFSCIIGGDQVPASKPDPLIFLTACEKMNVPPADALVLEDSENGVRAAINGGIPVICIPDMARPAEDVLAQAAAVADTASQVQGLFV